MFEVILHFRKRAFNRLDKIQAARCHCAASQDGLALKIIVRNNKDFAVRCELMRCAFDDLVGVLSGARINDFDFRRGFDFRFARLRTRAVENNRERRSAGIVKLSQFANQFIARKRGMSSLSPRKLRPAVQQAVTINEDSDESHAEILITKNQIPNTKSWPAALNFGLAD